MQGGGRDRRWGGTLDCEKGISATAVGAHRGVGTVFVHKVACAAAQEGLELDGVTSIVKEMKGRVEALRFAPRSLVEFDKRLVILLTHELTC